jgi:TRAP-type uncharacterized transport system fused permease subunit
VALAAYATASIAGASIMRTGLAAFRFSLVGFTLPFIFVYRPQLLLLAPDGQAAGLVNVAASTLVGAMGVLCIAITLAGFCFATLNWIQRAAFLLAAAFLLFPGELVLGPFGLFDILGGTVMAGAAAWSFAQRDRLNLAPA